MDFFAAQDQSRRKTRWLVLWFALAVAGIIAVVYLALAFAMGIGGADPHLRSPSVPLWDPALFTLTALVVGAFILLGSLYKIVALSSGGGAAVATGLGGRLIPRATGDPLERRLINVVEEMAIAAGIPAPPVYVLDQESGINAFAAGLRTTEGVVAVTRGTLERLSRDELQGVIAHEFSHILNGDMRLNLRLMGLLHGILLLALIGRVLMQAGRGSNRRGGGVVFVGLALLLVGSVGVLFGKLIKAGVSREREYLADASAVQFTRNPAGIAGALKHIAADGSMLAHPGAEEASHLFFASGAALSRLMATHPPIEGRIRRIEPDFELHSLAALRPAPAPGGAAGTPAAASASAATPISAAAPVPVTAPTPSWAPIQPQAPASAPSPATGPAPPDSLTPAAFVAAAGEVRPAHAARGHALIEALPAFVRTAVHERDGAQAAVLALLLSPRDTLREGQLETLRQRHGEALRDASLRVAEWLAGSGPEVRLPVLDLALATLGELTAEARSRLLTTADALIEADGRTSVFEFVLRSLLQGHLQPGAGAAKCNGSPAVLAAAVAALLGLLARAGHADEDAARTAFRSATRLLPLEGPLEFPERSALPSARALHDSLSALGACQPTFRKRLVEACAAAVLHDGRITVQEAELLRAVCQRLDVPVPPLLRYPDSVAPAGPLSGRL